MCSSLRSSPRPFSPLPLLKVSSLLMAAQFVSNSISLGFSTIANIHIAVDATTLAPASAVVDGEQLFPVERQQLTDEVLANLTDIGVDTTLFNFGSDDNVSEVEKRARGCKVFPGDKTWPSPAIWKILHLISGQRLIATIPSASSCYNDWPTEINPKECATVTNNWNISFFQ